MYNSDPDPNLTAASAAFTSAHSITRDLTLEERQCLRTLAQLVSNRAAAFLATAVHALWTLGFLDKGKNDCTTWEHVTIACNGSVLEKYPNFRERCQHYLDQLAIRSGAEKGAIMLEMSIDSSIYGAAVAAACINE